jgi:hypothetical protein
VTDEPAVPPTPRPAACRTLCGCFYIIGVPPKGEALPVEADLQYESYVWLAGPWEFAGRVRAERSDIATGRADVTVRFGDIELVTEVKRELADATPQALERSYLGQAAE